MKQGADWLAWSLQFIAGFFVGGILALSGLRRSWRVDSSFAAEHMLILVTGSALIGAALASYFGDRLWIGSSYRVIPPDDIPQSGVSKFVSILTGGIGAGLILIALLLNWHVI